ncbi:hypothetical protein GCM10022405_17100 [Gibbsiella dentisursi]|uniref:Uncharacterized protein n=1 Tax=Gibbsiella dentisursi TaxID=796890 RepID=A0ABP7KZY5_9GAMM
MPSLRPKPVIKASGAGHSGPMFKPDNAEDGLWGHDPPGWCHWAALLRCSPFIWARQTTRLAP